MPMAFLLNYLKFGFGGNGPWWVTASAYGCLLCFLVWTAAFLRSDPQLPDTEQSRTQLAPAPSPPAPIPPSPAPSTAQQSGSKKEKKTTNKPQAASNTANVTGSGNIVSQGQNGGQTAGTINNYNYLPTPDRIISPQSIAAITAAATPFAGRTLKLSIWTNGDPESERYAKQFEAIFRSAGWKIEISRALVPGHPVGIMIGAHADDPANPPSELKLPDHISNILHAMQRTGLSFQWHLHPTFTDDPLELIIGFRE